MAQIDQPFEEIVRNLVQAHINKIVDEEVTNAHIAALEQISKRVREKTAEISARVASSMNFDHTGRVLTIRVEFPEKLERRLLP